MRVIVIAGLAVVEKVDLTVALARHFVARGQRVAVIDNGGRFTIDADILPDDVILRHRSESVQSLSIPVYDDSETDVTLYIADETLHPDDLFIAVDEARSQGQIVDVVAVIDARTCDCFPQVRESLEMSADDVVHVPFNLKAVLEALS